MLLSPDIRNRVGRRGKATALRKCQGPRKIDVVIPASQKRDVEIGIKGRIERLDVQLHAAGAGTAVDVQGARRVGKAYVREGVA